MPSSTTSSPVAIDENQQYHDIPHDCKTIIFQYHMFHFSTTVSGVVDLNEGNHFTAVSPLGPDWKFLQKYALSVAFAAGIEFVDTNDSMPLEEFLDQCRHRELKQTFFHLQFRSLKTGALHEVKYLLRGVPQIIFGTVSIEDEVLFGVDEMMSVNHMTGIMENIRGVQRLNLNFCKMPFPATCYEELRGIPELTLTGCVPEDSYEDEQLFQNLRGVKHLCLHDSTYSSLDIIGELRGIESLIITSCDMSLSEQDFKSLRGIRKLHIYNIDEEFVLTDQIVKHLRGIEELIIDNLFTEEDADEDEDAKFTNAAFQNLRGIRLLSLCGAVQYHNITDEAFVNLRGIQTLIMGDFYRVTDSIFEQLRGIEELDIEESPNIAFCASTLSNLRGVRVLRWHRNFVESLSRTGKSCIPEKHLDDACLRQLCGVQHLHLGDVVTISNDAFCHLNQVVELSLEGMKDCKKSIPLRESAFSHLENVEKITLKHLVLEVGSFSRLWQDNMPKLQEFKVTNCRVLESSLESPEDQGLISLEIHGNADKFVYASFQY